MKKQIAVTRETRLFMMKLFGVTERMLTYALTYKKDSDLARRIRKCAIERGGVVLVTLPEIETFHDYDGTMRQYLPNGAYLEFLRSDGSGHVFMHGEEVAKYENVTVQDIYKIQDYALRLR